MTHQILRAGGLGEHEVEALRQFDLTGRYGPCTGITRLQRCARALPQQTGRPASLLMALRPAPMTFTTCTLWPSRHGLPAVHTQQLGQGATTAQTCLPESLSPCTNKKAQALWGRNLKPGHLTPGRAAASGLC